MLGFIEMVLMQQSLFSDMTRLMYVSNVYNLHFEALSDCSADLIKENCKPQCTKRAIPDIAKILPSKGIEIRCPGETTYFSKSLEIGSTRFTLTCTFCKIFWNNRLVGSSSEIRCKEERRRLIETLLTIQFCELKLDGDDGVEKTVFNRSQQLINPQYDPETGSNNPPINILPTLCTVASVA
ncbi:unnamed protein product [Orchesella dallaii]|uniref:Uncharacterized protein n=1 Tax=Orchesella dallaii TaxID=48710 RepID=A0ABP1PXP3_9HEXA